MIATVATSHALLLVSALVAAMGFVAALIQQAWSLAFVAAAVAFLAAAFLVA